MPPIFMLIAVALVVLLVAFGNNPLDKIREENAKYGTDPLVREINKYNEENKTISSGTGVYGVDNYSPPEGAKLYRLPPSQVIMPPPAFTTGSKGGALPAPEIPFENWGKDNYPAYMMAPKTDIPMAPPPSGVGIIPNTAPNAAPGNVSPGTPVMMPPEYGTKTGGPIGRPGSYTPPAGLSPSVTKPQ